MSEMTCMRSPSDDETTCQAIERAYQAHKPGPSKDFTRDDAQRVALIHLLITQIDADTDQYKTAVRNTLTDKDTEHANVLIAFIEDTLSDPDYDPYRDVDDCWDEYGNFIGTGYTRQEFSEFND